MSTSAGMPRKSLREAKRAEQQRRQLLMRAAWGLAGLIVLAVVGYFVWDVIRPKPGQSVPQLSRTHIQLGDPHEPYNSDPPTSGPHAAPVEAGFYTEALPDENLVHNLEHGYVIIWYNCARLDDGTCQTLKTQIQSVMDRARPVVITSGAKKLIAVPRPKMDTLIALTSWGRIDKLNKFKESEMLEFIDSFRNQAPEPGAP